MSAQMDSLSSRLNPSSPFCFAPTSLGSCKAAESHLGRVTCPQHGRDQHLLGTAAVRVRQAGQEQPALAGSVGSVGSPDGSGQQRGNRELPERCRRGRLLGQAPRWQS